MHQIVELGHIAVRRVHRDDLMLAGGGIVVTCVTASTAAKQRRRSLSECGGAARGKIACEVSRRYEFRRKFVKKSTKFTFLYAEGAVIARKKRKFTQNAPLFYIYFSRATRELFILYLHQI